MTQAMDFIATIPAMADGGVQKSAAQPRMAVSSNPSPALSWPGLFSISERVRFIDRILFFCPREAYAWLCVNLARGRK